MSLNMGHIPLIVCTGGFVFCKYLKMLSNVTIKYNTWSRISLLKWCRSLSLHVSLLAFFIEFHLHQLEILVNTKRSIRKTCYYVILWLLLYVFPFPLNIIFLQKKKVFSGNLCLLNIFSLFRLCSKFLFQCGCCWLVVILFMFIMIVVAVLIWFHLNAFVCFCCFTE